MTRTAFITSVNGTMIAEVDGIKYWETVDVASRFGWGESVELSDEFSDGWELVDLLEEALDQQ